MISRYLGYNRLFESGYELELGNGEMISKIGTIDVYDFKLDKIIKVPVNNILKVCSDAMYKMYRDYPFMYNIIQKCKLMYIPNSPSKICDTMMVDSMDNLWINLHYVYNNCLMDSNRVFGILFHEMFHVFFDHCIRFTDMYKEEMFDGIEGAYKKANQKANICMDYEVNSSMVVDGIVDKTFWKRMNGLYKEEYAGMTWEQIMAKAGDKEYKEWLERNGKSLDDVEMKLLEAIERASKVLFDKDATDDEKRAARKRFKKEVDDILGRNMDGEKSLQDEIEELADTPLGDIPGLSDKIDDVVDDLYKDPRGMSDSELGKTLSDMDSMCDSMSEHAEEMAKRFKKDESEYKADVEKARKSMKDVMEKMHDGSLSEDEKTDMMDAAKDALEDILADDLGKEKLKKKREEREKKKAAERLEKFKKTHSLRALITVLKNIAGLGEYMIIHTDTNDACIDIINVLEPMTAYHYNEMKKEDWDKIRSLFDKLKGCAFKDLVRKIKDDTILNKDEDDMKNILDKVMEHVNNGIDTALRDDLDDTKIGSVIRSVAAKLRVLGKLLKTQKVWATTEEFKKGYTDEAKRLIGIQRKYGDEGLLKELINMHLIYPANLDRKSEVLYTKIFKIKGCKKSETGTIKDDAYTWGNRAVNDFVHDDLIGEYVSKDFHEGKVYYDLHIEDRDGDKVPCLMLSKEKNVIFGNPDAYIPLQVKFEKDHREYVLYEFRKARFVVYDKDKDEYANIDIVKKILEKHPDYVKGEWMEK